MQRGCMCVSSVLYCQGLLPEQVATAEGLTIRVINNVTKKCDVSSFRGSIKQLTVGTCG